MQLSPSAHTDTFCRDNLPPGDQWPDLRFDLPELRYPDRLNCAEALLDAIIARFGADRPCLRTTTETWTYGDLVAGMVLIGVGAALVMPTVSGSPSR